MLTTAPIRQNKKMTQGFIYILAEVDSTDVITVDSTGRHPEDRVREMADETQGKAPILCYYAWSDDAVQDVAHVQQYLFDRRETDGPRFEIEPRQAIRIIESRLEVKRMYLNENLVGFIESNTYDYDDERDEVADTAPGVNPWLRNDTKPTKLRGRRKSDTRQTSKRSDRSTRRANRAASANHAASADHATAADRSTATVGTSSTLAPQAASDRSDDTTGSISGESETALVADAEPVQPADPVDVPATVDAANIRKSKSTLPTITQHQSQDLKPDSSDAGERNSNEFSPVSPADKERLIQQAKSLSEQELASVQNDELSRRIDETIAFELHQERNRQRELRLHEEHQRQQFEQAEAARRLARKRVHERRALVLTEKRKREAEAYALEEHALQEELERKRRALGNRQRLETKLARRRQLSSTIRIVSLVLLVATLLGWFWGSHNSAGTSGISSLLPTSQTVRY